MKHDSAMEDSGNLYSSAVLGADVTMNPGVSRTPFIELPFPPPIAGPAHRPTLEQHLHTLTTWSFPPDHPTAPPVLPALPRAPLGGGDACQGLAGTGAGNIMDQVRSEAEQPQRPQDQTIVSTQYPSNWNAPGAIYEGAACPEPLFLEASVVEMIMPGSAFGSTQSSQGGSCPGLPSEAPPPAAQLAPNIPPVNAGPWPHRPSREGGLATSQPKASPDGSLHWAGHGATLELPIQEERGRDRLADPGVLAGGLRLMSSSRVQVDGLPQVQVHVWCECEAVTAGAGKVVYAQTAPPHCRPVLRSLSRLKPTMTLEEGIGQAMQEWESTSNFDRMTYYNMAAKFMEFEAEEDMQIQKLQLTKGAQGPSLPAPPRPDPQGSPTPVVGSQPANTPSTQCAHPLQQPGETKSPNGIPPEAVQEYMDTMDYLEGLAHSASGEPGGERKEDTKEWYEEEGFLSYLDELCSQNDFVTQLEEVIHPLFMARALSPGADMHLSDLAEKMEQEEGVSPAQDVRNTHHSGLNVPPRLSRIAGALTLDWDPGSPPFPESPLLFGSLAGQWTVPWGRQDLAASTSDPVNPDISLEPAQWGRLEAHRGFIRG
ncbi:NUT family member 2G-like [Molossus nigricans]